MTAIFCVQFVGATAYRIYVRQSL